MARYVQPKQPGFFDKSDRLQELEEMGDPLARLDSIIDWSTFEPILDQLGKGESFGGGGRPAFRPLLMFKCLVIQRLYDLSDAQLQFQITDRVSFKRFLGMTDADRCPDEKTFWAFRELLTQTGLFDELFAVFHDRLVEEGMIANKGKIIDASFVEVPRQRNSKEENEAIKQGELPEGWEEQENRLRQKDLDARWTKKRNERHYGYKNHVKVDSKSKLIDKYTVTDAAVHDSNALDELLCEGDSTTYVDSAYSGSRCEEIFAAKGVESKIIEPARRNRPLSKKAKRKNRTKSRTRVRVEHVFGTMVMSMRATWNRCIGIARNEASIAMTNLVYNMIRYEQISRLKLKRW